MRKKSKRLCPQFVWLGVASYMRAAPVQSSPVVVVDGWATRPRHHTHARAHRQGRGRHQRHAATRGYSHAASAPWPQPNSRSHARTNLLFGWASQIIK